MSSSILKVNSPAVPDLQHEGSFSSFVEPCHTSSHNRRPHSSYIDISDNVTLNQWAIFRPNKDEARKAPIKCLYIDDNIPLLELVKEYLDLKNDFIVTICNTPEKAEGLLRENDFDVVISDYEMPNINGIELFEWLSASGWRMPFILFTGRGREEVAINALNAGIDFYLKKGGDVYSQFAELENAIRQLMRRKEAEEVTASNTRHFSQLIGNVMDVLLIMDGKGVIRYANPFIVNTLGYEPEEIVGVNVLTLIHPEDQQPEMTVDGSTLLVHDRLKEFRMLKKDGMFRWFEGKMSWIRDGCCPENIILNAWDIHEKKILEGQIIDQESIIQEFFNNSNEYMMALSLDGDITSVNRKVCDGSGYTEGELMGRPVTDLISSRDIGTAKDRLRVRAEGDYTPITYSLMMRDKNGSEKLISMSSRVLAIPNKKPLIIITAVDSFSDRHDGSMKG